FVVSCVFIWFFFFFFFSSRRRHTRCLSDWSSDVCSSDLGMLVIACADHHRVQLRVGQQLFRVLKGLGPHAEKLLGIVGGPIAVRSEERRVGKECRAGGWAW